MKLCKLIFLILLDYIEFNMKIIFFGAPGSGKGTYAARIAPILGVPHISTGQIFRAHMAQGTPLGKRIDANMKKGILTDDKTTNEIVEERIAEKDCKRGYILDGYPRTMPQALFLERISKSNVVIDFVLDEKIIIEKTAARRVCENCGEIYNVADIKRGGIHLPPIRPKKNGICDKCSGHLVQRSDDTERVIKDRIKVYHTQSEPLIEYYSKKELLEKVKVTGSPDVMVPTILKIVNKREK